MLGSDLKFLYICLALVDCEWGEWVPGGCSKSCEGGIRLSSREKTVPEQFGGICEGDPFVEEPCNQQMCPGIYQIFILFA